MQIPRIIPFGVEFSWFWPIVRIPMYSIHKQFHMCSNWYMNIVHDRVFGAYSTGKEENGRIQPKTFVIDSVQIFQTEYCIIGQYLRMKKSFSSTI